MSSPDSFHSPELSPSLSSVESLRTSLPQEYQSLFDTLRRAVIDFCSLHHILTSSLNNDKALREATKHLSIPELEQLSLVLARLDHLVRHKEPMREERVSLTQEQAREIMGANMLGTIEVEQHFGELSFEQEEAFSVIPFSKETLEVCRETHILVADRGISLMNIRDVKTLQDKKLFHSQSWYENHEFTKRIETTRWRLIRKTPVEGSLGETWDEQQTLINQETDEIPSARQVVYTMILYFLTTGEQLFRTLYVRTSDVGSDGYHAVVGCFDAGGFYVYNWDDGRRDDSLGVASSRKVF